MSYILLGIKDSVIVGISTGDLDDIAAQKSRYDKIASSCGIELRIEQLDSDEIGNFTSASTLTEVYSHLIDKEE